MKAFVLVLITTLALACPQNNSNTCSSKFNKTVKKSQIPISKTQSILISSYNQKEYIKKSDLLSIYLIKSTNPIYYKLSFKKHFTNTFTRGDISIRTDNCCYLNSLQIKNYTLSKNILKYFLDVKNKNVNFADAGFRVKNINNKIIVSSVDFAYKNLKIKVGDEILFYGKTKIKSVDQLNELVLLSKIDSRVVWSIKRASKKLIFSSILDKRVGGYSKSDTYLERFGFNLNQNLVVKNDINRYSIKKGDKILMLSEKSVKSQNDIREAILVKEGKISILISRDSFEFFVKVEI